jgi:glycerol kinase
VLPEIRSSSEAYGVTKNVRGLPDGLPVCGIAGDQQAALFGQACFQPGEAKCTYGTGAFLLQNVGSEPVVSRHGLLTTVAWRIGSQTDYALEGSSFIAGAAVQWLRDQLKLIAKASDVETLAKTVKDSGGVVFVPALAGLGAPHWRPEARGLIAGIHRGTTTGHLARAVLEGIAFQIHDLSQAMAMDAGKSPPVFRVDGGASANDLLMQFQADLLDVPVERPRMLETTALGAAFLAGLAAGIWSSRDEIGKAYRAGKRFEPRMKPEERERYLALWRRAVAAA